MMDHLIPHPKLMPSYWQFPIYQMGLGPLQQFIKQDFKIPYK